MILLIIHVTFKAKPVPRIPAGKAKKVIPNVKKIAVSNLPTHVSGYLSPYPTVVKLTIPHHKASAKLLNI